MDVRALATEGMVLTQGEVELEIDRLLGLMGERTDELAQLSVRASESETDYKRRFATEFIRSTGTVKDREQLATLNAIEEFGGYKRADALLRSGQESLRTIRAALDALRTISANVRAIT